MWAALKRLTKPRSAIVLFGSQPFTSALVMSNPKWFRYEWVWDKEIGTNFFNTKIQPLNTHENILVFSDGIHTYKPLTTPAERRNIRTIPVKPYSGNTYGSGSVNFTRKDKHTRLPVSVVVVNSMVAETHRTKRIHPTQKPLALLEYLVKTYTNEGDTVLDFAMGSGTTGEACLNTGRVFIGIEKDQGYFDIAAARLAAAASRARQLEMAV